MVTAREIIRKEYHGSKNFITPHVLNYGKIDKDTAYEISEGVGIGGEKIFGLSVVSVDEYGKTKKEFGISRLFHTKSKLKSFLGDAKSLSSNKLRSLL